MSLIEISRVLEETARLVREHAGTIEGAARRERDPAVAEALRVRAIIAARRLRRQYLGLAAADAAWSMMLELYAARLEGRSLNQTELGLAAGVPQTTALRVTRQMLAKGVFTRDADPDDKRLLVIRLSGEAAGRMRAYLAATRFIAGSAV